MARRSHFSFTVTILTAFATVFVIALSCAIVGYRQAGAELAIETADARLAQAAQTAAARAEVLIGPVLALGRSLSASPRPVDPPGHPAATLVASLDAVPSLLAAAIALPDGTLHQAMRIASLPADVLPSHPNLAVWVVREGGLGMRTTSWRFLAPDGHEISHTETQQQVADSRAMTWVLQARDPGVHISTLYDLPFLRRPGLSVSAPLADGSGVIGFDLSLETLGAFLQQQAISRHGAVFLFDGIGIILAHQDPNKAVLQVRDGSGERTVWITASSSPDPTIRAVWHAYAIGQLQPGNGETLDVNGVPTLVRLETIHTRERLEILAAVAAPRADFTGPVTDAIARGTTMAMIAFAVGLAWIGLVSWRIARPLGVLTREAEGIRRFELSQPLALSSRITEIDRLATAMMAMKMALATFGAYVPRDLVRQFLRAGSTPHIGGERRPLTIMFTDVEGFTALAETLEPEELARITSAYFEELTAELLDAGATIDKYIGDAVMALWNAPSPDPDHAAHACRAALRARLLTNRLIERFAERGWPGLPTRFGIHTGEAVVGNVGSRDRLSYTAMGSMVNLANRLEGLTRFYGTQILVSDETRRRAGEAFVFRSVDLVYPKGATLPIAIHELMGESGPASISWAAPSVVERLPAWERCIEAYRTRRFGEAWRALEAAGGAEADTLAAVYAARLRKLRERPVAADWSPAIRYTEK